MYIAGLEVAEGNMTNGNLVEGNMEVVAGFEGLIELALGFGIEPVLMEDTLETGIVVGFGVEEMLEVDTRVQKNNGSLRTAHRPLVTVLKQRFGRLGRMMS